MMTAGRPVGRRKWLKGAAGLGLAACSERAPAQRDRTVRSAALFLGGDVHVGHGRAAPIFESLDEVLAGRVGIVNLEGPVGDPPEPSADPSIVRLANAAAALPLLAAAGVRAAGIANNHAADRGPAGRVETASALEAAGLAVADGPRAAIVEQGGLRVAITAHDLAAGTPAAEDLERARAGADVLVATFHVTGPPSYVPRPELRRAADVALEAGASVVAAHGTHALGPVERRGGAVIAWGLGNLVFSCDCTREVDGALLLVTLGGPRVEAAIAPIEAGLDGRPARAAKEAALLFELLGAIGSSPMQLKGDVATF